MVRVRRWWAAVAALLTLVGALSWGLAAAPAGLTRLDTAVGSHLVCRGEGTSIIVLQVLTAPGDERIRALLVMPGVGFLVYVRRFALAAAMALPALLISPLNRAVKDVFERPRPSYAGTTVTAGDWSFPSGHSSGAAVLAGVLLLALLPHAPPRWRRALVAVAALSALVIGWTRLALGVHYLSDVVAGIALGAAVVLVGALLFGVVPGPGSGARPGRGAGSGHGLRRRPGRLLRPSRRGSPAAERHHVTGAGPA